MSAPIKIHITGPAGSGKSLIMTALMDLLAYHGKPVVLEGTETMGHRDFVQSFLNLKHITAEEIQITESQSHEHTKG